MKQIIFLLCLSVLFSCNQQGSKSGDTSHSDSTKTVVDTLAAKPVVPVDTVKIDTYPNGKQKLVAKLKDGVMNGPYQTFFEDGKPQETGTMTGGNKTGVWREYNNKGKLEKVDVYNNNQVIISPNPKDYDLKLHKMPKVGLQIMVPKSWKSEDNPSKDQPVIFVSAKNCTEADVFCPNMSITLDKLDTVTFEQYIQIGHQILKEQFPGFELLNEHRDSIDGMPTYQTQYSGVIHNMKLMAITKIINKGGAVYVFTGMARDTPVGEFEKFKSMFLEAADSFRALQP